jgi:hypothetical protein
MRRRELLKALAAVPFAAAIGGCDNDKKDDKKEEKHTSIAEVHLDGAFALVLQKNKGNSLLAFSPKPPSGEAQHQVFLNGYKLSESGANKLNFALVPERKESERHEPEINPGLNDFFFETERWRVGDSLITIELPPPDTITFIGHRSPVVFKDGRHAWMPTNRVLKYELHGDAAKLECRDTSIKCTPSPDSYPGVTRHFFEIGPAASLNFAESHAHAIKLFNYILQQCFPDLFQKYSLLEPGERQAPVNPRLAPTVFQYDVPMARLQEASYITDCEFSGPSVGTRSAPTP